jgi:hypothetical protein
VRTSAAKWEFVQVNRKVSRPARNSLPLLIGEIVTSPDVVTHVTLKRIGHSEHEVELQQYYLLERPGTEWHGGGQSWPKLGEPMKFEAGFLPSLIEALERATKRAASVDNEGPNANGE